MRLAVASDIHGDYLMTRRFGMAALGLNASAIIIAGDIGPNAEKVLSYLSQLEIPIYLVLGNDDFPFDAYILEGIPYVLNIDGECIDVGPVEIIGLSGNPGSGLASPDEKKIEAALQNVFTKASKPVILVSHLPPFRVLDLATRYREKGEHIGSKAIRKIIEQYKPVLCVCGHVHKDGGKRAFLEDTEVINVAALENDEVSKNQSRRFAVVEIDEKKRCISTFDYLINADLTLEKFIRKYV